MVYQCMPLSLSCFLSSFFYHFVFFFFFSDSQFFFSYSPPTFGPIFMATSLPFILLESMGFLHFVLKTSPTVFGFLWASLQDFPLIRWLFGHYLYLECACCAIHHSKTKFLVLFLLPPPLCLTRMDKDWRLFLYLPIWHASSGFSHLLLSFG